MMMMAMAMMMMVVVMMMKLALPFEATRALYAHPQHARDAQH